MFLRHFYKKQLNTIRVLTNIDPDMTNALTIVTYSVDDLSLEPINYVTTNNVVSVRHAITEILSTLNNSDYGLCKLIVKSRKNIIQELQNHFCSYYYITHLTLITCDICDVSHITLIPDLKIQYDDHFVSYDRLRRKPNNLSYISL